MCVINLDEWSEWSGGNANGDTIPLVSITAIPLHNQFGIILNSFPQYTVAIVVEFSLVKL